jgi:hypothetical protein
MVILFEKFVFETHMTNIHVSTLKKGVSKTYSIAVYQ